MKALPRDNRVVFDEKPVTGECRLRLGATVTFRQMARTKIQQMGRFLIVAFAAWIAIGGCGAPLISCPLYDSASHHGCCPRNSPVQGLSACPYFVAVKVAPVSAIVIAGVSSALVPAAFSELQSGTTSLIQDQHGLYLRNRLLRI
jgi:hypothetical protein